MKVRPYRIAIVQSFSSPRLSVARNFPHGKILRCRAKAEKKKFIEKFLRVFFCHFPIRQCWILEFPIAWGIIFEFQQEFLLFTSIVCEMQTQPRLHLGIFRHIWERFYISRNFEYFQLERVERVSMINEILIVCRRSPSLKLNCWWCPRASAAVVMIPKQSLVWKLTVATSFLHSLSHSTFKFKSLNSIIHLVPDYRIS